MDLEPESSIEIINRFKKSAFPADVLVLIFTLFLLILGILNYTRLGQPYAWISTDCGVIIILLILISKENLNERRSYSWLHFFWPVITVAFLYTQCATRDNLIFSHPFDPILMKWDTALFGTVGSTVLAPAVDNLLVDELMHAFYFSYYLVLFLPAAWMFWRRNSRAYELIFSLVLMLYIHFLVFMIFPADGPISDRSNLFGRGVIFIPLMDFIYQTSGQNGGGAFPSTHVSSAVLVFLYTFKYIPRLRIFTGICCIGIIIATVYCSYHYAVDSFAGIITGTLFFYLGQYIYARWLNPALQPLLAIQHNA